MTDYIKREDAIEYLVDNMAWMDADGIETSEEDKRDAMAELINSVPPADVAPVRHGRWKKEYGHYKCLLCNCLDDFADNYCPYCGAKMDEEE